MVSGARFPDCVPPDGAQSGNLGHSNRERTVSSFFGAPSLGALGSCPVAHPSIRPCFNGPNSPVFAAHTGQQ
jgi:hypothetical protein